MENNNRKNENPWKAFAVVSAIGIELAVLLLVGIWLGKKIDLIYNTSPMFLVAGIIFGLILGILSIVKLIKPFLGD